MKHLVRTLRERVAGRRGKAKRARGLRTTVTAGLIAALPVLARAEPARPDRALPCNELCRAWLSWTPDRSPAWAGGVGHDDVVPEAAPRFRARSTKEDAVARRAESPKRSPVRLGAADPPARQRSEPRIAYALPPPRRPTPASEPKPFGKAGAEGGSALKNDQPPEGIAFPPRDATADRPWAAADAAVLAAPLYQPPETTGAADGTAEHDPTERPAPEPRATEQRSPQDGQVAVAPASAAVAGPGPVAARDPAPPPDVPPAPVAAAMPPEVSPPRQIGKTQAARPRWTRGDAGSARRG